MKKTALAVALAVTFVAPALPAYTQFGGLTRGIDKAAKAKEKVDKVADAVSGMSEKDERALGEQVSEKLRTEFGVLQDAKVTKYVTLVGNVLAQSSTRPGLKWEFIVLDTDGVNAFAAPGGLVHITKGLLGLLKNEAELAGALGHEITHITKKHTLGSIQRGKMVSLGADEVGSNGLAASAIAKLADASYKHIINNSFDRGDEMDADHVGVQLASKAGYQPSALADVLGHLADRNKDQKEPNGLFASHPVLKDRIANIQKIIKDEKLGGTAIVAARYKSNISFEARPLADIPVIAGTRGLTGGSDSKDAKKEDPKKEEPKKEEPKKGMFGKVGLTGGSQAQNTQTVASAGARGINPDRDATGGSNPRKLTVPLTAAELDAFKKGIA